MKKILFALSLGSFLFSSAFAQHAGNVRYHGQEPAPNIVPVPKPVPQPQVQSLSTDFHNYTFEIHGLFNATADAYVAVFNIVQLGETAAEADQLISKRVETLAKDLLALGIPAKNLHVDMISQVAIYEYQTEKKLFSKDTYLEVPKGIELQKNLHITFPDGNQLDDILAAAARQDIYDLVKVDYYLADQEAMMLQLQREVIAFHLKQRTQYQQLGVRLDTAKVGFAGSTAVYSPLSQYQSYNSTSSSTLRGLKSEEGVQEIRKPQTLYYRPLAPERFDVVINPVIDKPVIQLTYTLHVRYFLAPEQPVQVEVRTETKVIRQQDILILTPDGKVTPLTLTDE